MHDCAFSIENAYFEDNVICIPRMTRMVHCCVRRIGLLSSSRMSPQWAILAKEMENETNLAKNEALKTLYQKAQVINRNLKS